MTVFMCEVGIHLFIYSFVQKYFWTPPQLSTETGMSEIQSLTPKAPSAVGADKSAGTYAGTPSLRNPLQTQLMSDCHEVKKSGLFVSWSPESPLGRLKQDTI